MTVSLKMGRCGVLYKFWTSVMLDFQNLEIIWR